MHQASISASSGTKYGVTASSRRSACQAAASSSACTVSSARSGPLGTSWAITGRTTSGGEGRQRRRQRRLRAAAAGDAPVAGEERVRVGGDRPFDDEAQVDPGRLVGPADEILAGQVAAAAPQPAAVDGDQLAVVAQVGAAAQRVVQHRHEAAHLHAGAVEHAPLGARGAHAAEGVDQQAHHDAAPRRAGQRGGDAAAGGVVAEQVGAAVDALARPADERQQGAQRLFAVGMEGGVGVGRAGATSSPASSCVAQRGGRSGGAIAAGCLAPPAPCRRPAAAAATGERRSGRANLRVPNSRNSGSAT